MDSVDMSLIGEGCGGEVLCVKGRAMERGSNDLKTYGPQSA